MSDAESKQARSSCSTSSGPRFSTWKSDMCIVPPGELEKLTGRNSLFSDARSSCGEYYKKYDHDEKPEKDAFSFTGTGDNQHSLTNTEIDKLETHVLQNLSRELQGVYQGECGSSLVSLDSHIKFFKTTVQQIFDNFYTSMNDFERYKVKFHEILEKNKHDSVAEMEQFIKDMIHDILSTDSLANQDVLDQESKRTFDVDPSEEKIKQLQDMQDENIQTNDTTVASIESESLVQETYKNDNFMSDTTTGTNTNAENKSRVSENSEIFNIYVMNTPYLEIKMHDRHMLSEINIRRSTSSNVSKVASADNSMKLAAKKKENEIYVEHEEFEQDRNYPVKMSTAKKNIHLDEDFVYERERSDAKSIMARICNYICKKIRKTY